MPVITVEGGKLSLEQKRNLLHRLTSVASEVTSISSAYFTVLMREREDAILGIGGETVEEMNARLKK